MKRYRNYAVSVVDVKTKTTKYTRELQRKQMSTQIKPVLRPMYPTTKLVAGSCPGCDDRTLSHSMIWSVGASLSTGVEDDLGRVITGIKHQLLQGSVSVMCLGQLRQDTTK